jgi:hypothetical protein
MVRIARVKSACGITCILAGLLMSCVPITHRHEIESAVAALGQERVMSFGLGTPYAADTASTQRVLGYGQAAVPPLVQAF